MELAGEVLSVFGTDIPRVYLCYYSSYHHHCYPGPNGTKSAESNTNPPADHVAFESVMLPLPQDPNTRLVTRG